MYDKRGPLPVPAVPYALRAEQDQAEGYAENIVRVAAIDGHEPSVEPNVFQGTTNGVFLINKK